MGLSCDLHGEVAVVTGGSRGIGFALASALAGCGATVVVVNRSADEGEAAARAISAVQAEPAYAVAADVRSPEAVADMVQAVRDLHGRVDLLVTAAGVNVRRPALEVAIADLDLMIDVNLKGVFHCCRAVAPLMIEAGGGRIINVSSLAGLHGFLNRAPYSATKAGVSQLTRALALEWARFGIRVNAVAPGLVRTPLTEAYITSDPLRYERVVGKIPLGRFGSPEDIVGTALFLASPASAYLTGQTIVVDGGYGLGCMDW